jgi:hypothetical protein
MAEIIVNEVNSSTYQVTVQAQSTSIHMVSVRPEYIKGLLKPNESVADLLKRSFEFLLQRESNSSILQSFDLSVIGRYFPEYEREMGK